MKKFILAVGGVIALLAVVVVFRALTLDSRQVSVAVVDTLAVDPDSAAAHLGQVLRFKTISPQNPVDFDPQPFLDMRAYLEATYPRVHATLTRDVVNGFSLLYRWPGRDPALEPVLLMGHMDVVPVEPGTEDKWTRPAFGGDVADGYIWGRGALDDKGSVVAILEAVERLLETGFAPERTVYLAFGHDEEIGGRQGAAKIAGLLAERRVHVSATFDEGMAIIQGAVPGIDAPVAMVALAEKGFASFELISRAKGGHSSMPPKRTALGAISRAIVRLESHKRPAALHGPAAAMFDYLAPEMGFGYRLLFANRWLFGPLIVNRMTRAPATNAMVRTTTAPTIIHGGVKENVLPSEVRAVVNFRIIPGETHELLRRHIIKVIDDPEIEVKLMERIVSDPSPVADVNSASFGALNRSIREVFPGMLVAPGLVLGGTDTVHYRDVSDAGYRFVPFRMGPADFSRVHGTNERQAVGNFVEVIQFYGQLIRNLAGTTGP